jgi:hypothetical protein
VVIHVAIHQNAAVIIVDVKIAVMIMNVVMIMKSVVVMNVVTLRMKSVVVINVVVRMKHVVVIMNVVMIIQNFVMVISVAPEMLMEPQRVDNLCAQTAIVHVQKFTTRVQGISDNSTVVGLPVHSIVVGTHPAIIPVVRMFLRVTCTVRMMN